MRFNLVNLNDQIIGFVDSDKNPKLMTTGLLILSVGSYTRYFAYNGALQNPAFLEREEMVISPAEIEHDSNNHTSTESA